jgi:hypothetical protein
MKIVMIVVWALAIIGLAVLGIKQATEKAYDGNFIEEQTISINTGDTLQISMKADKQFSYEVNQDSGWELKYTEDDKKVIYSNDIKLNIKVTKDAIGKIVIEKSAEGNNILDAKKRAEAIDYSYSFNNNSLMLNGFFITDTANKYRDQQIEITLYLPEGTIVYLEENTGSYSKFNAKLNEIRNWDFDTHYFRILKNNFECLDCTEKIETLKKTDSSETINSEKVMDTTIEKLNNKNWEEGVNNKFKNS